MDNSPFESIESAQEFVELLIESVRDACDEVKVDIERAGESGEIRQKQALLVVAHQLNLLSTHLAKSRRILNDLRSLRRLLLNERKLVSTTVTEPATSPHGIDPKKRIRPAESRFSPAKM